MTKLIVEMEMPCNIQYLAGLHGTPTCPIERRTCKDGNNPPKWCPIKGVLPDEHGDLIDRTSLYADVVGVILSHSGLNFSEVLARQKAVIAAERKDDGN